MSNADMLVEMIRLAEQFGKVEQAHQYPDGYSHVNGKTKDGKQFTLSLSFKEEEKDA